MAKRKRLIAGMCWTNPLSPSEGGGSWGSTHQNGLRPYPIYRAGTNLQLVLDNARLNHATNGESSDLLVSLGLRGYTGAAANGSGWIKQQDIVVLKGQILTTPLFALSVSVGDQLNISIHTEATEVGKQPPGVRQIYDTDRGEGGVATKKLDGELLSDPTSLSIYKQMYSAAQVVAMTREKSMCAVGHSVVRGGEDFDRGWVKRAEPLIGIPILTTGRGGSSIAAWDINDGQYDVVRAGDVLLIQYGINQINSYVGTPSAYADSVKAAWKLFIDRFRAMGVKVYLVTEAFCGNSASAQNINTRANWHQFLRASGVSYFGVDGIIDLTTYLETATDNHVPLAGRSTDIHGNAPYMAQAVADYFNIGGPGHSAIVADVDTFEEVFSSDFEGPLTTRGTVPGWTEWLSGYGQASSLYIDGKGHVAIDVSGGTPGYQTYLMNAAPLQGKFEVFAVSCLWNIAGNQQGLCLGFHRNASTNNALPSIYSGYGREGYSFRICNTGAAQAGIYSRRNKAQADGADASWSILTNFAGRFELNDIVGVKITREVVGTDNVFTTKIYRNGTLVFDGVLTDAAAPVSYRSDLYLSLGSCGDGATVAVNGPLWDYVIASFNNPITIDAVTPASDTIQIVAGDTLGFSTLVHQSLPTPGPASAVAVTASIAGIAGATVGASETTNGSGIATWTNSAGLSVPSSAAVGATGTITLTSGGIVGTITVQVVAAYSGGEAGTGIEGEDDMAMAYREIAYTPSDTALVTDVLAVRRQGGFFTLEDATLVVEDLDGGRMTVEMTAGRVKRMYVKKILDTGSDAVTVYLRDERNNI